MAKFDGEFGNLLMSYFAARPDIKPADLARELDVNPGTISHWQRGEQLPGRSALVIKIAKVFGLSDQERKRLLIAAGHSDAIPHLPNQRSDSSGIKIEITPPIESLVWREDAFFSLSRNFIDSSAYIQRKSNGFIGRQFVFDALDRYLNSNDQKSGYFIIRGEPGIGKTAFMAQLVKQRGYPHHFNIAAEGITQQQFYLNATAQVIAYHHLDYASLPYEADKNSNFLKQVLQEAALKGGKVILVIDALDEAPKPLAHTATNPLYLPEDLPEGVYIVVSTRRTATTIELNVHNFEVFEFEESSENNLQDVREYIGGFGRREPMKARLHEWKIDFPMFMQVMCKKSEGNFMYLYYVLPAIERGEFRTDNVDELPVGLRGYYQRHWTKMRGDDLNNFVQVYQRVVAKLATAREPVSADWVAFMSDLDVAVVNWSIEKWWEFLHEMTVDGQKRYRIYHQSYTDFLAQKTVEQL